MSASSELFLVNVIRWRWRRGIGTPSYQDEEWTTLEGWVYVYVCVCYVPRICCQVIYTGVMLCLLSPPLLVLFPLVSSSHLPLFLHSSPPTCLFSFPSSPPSLIPSLPPLTSPPFLPSYPPFPSPQQKILTQILQDLIG